MYKYTSQRQHAENIRVLAWIDDFLQGSNGLSTLDCDCTDNLVHFVAPAAKKLLSGLENVFT